MRIPLTLERRRAGRVQTAHSIVEVMVAASALAIMVVALYVGFSSGFAIVQQARENLRATQIMIQRMEAVRLCTWSQLTNFSFVDRYDPLGVSSNMGGTVYSGTVSIDAADAVPEIPEAYRSNMRLVTVKIYWTNGSVAKPIVRVRQMETHVARYGMQNYLYGMP
jgi:hypothetical protein